MESISQDESGLPPPRFIKGLVALPGYRSPAGISLSRTQIGMLVVAVVVAIGSIVGIAVAGAGSVVSAPDTGTQRALTFCEKVYSYPEFFDAHDTTGWALLR